MQRLPQGLRASACSGEMQLWQRSTVVFSREGGGSRIRCNSPANLFDPMNSAPWASEERAAMCLGGERRDRPHSGQSLRGEYTGSCPGGLPRDGQLHTYCIRGRGPAPSSNQQATSNHRRYFLEDGQNPGTSRCAVILSTNQLATFLWKMNEFFFSFKTVLLDHIHVKHIFILPTTHS